MSIVGSEFLYIKMPLPQPAKPINTMTRFDPMQSPEVTVIMVSYNTRDLTVKAIETLFENAGNVSFRLVVWDNASHDGSADAIAARFPDVELIRSDDNIGFARANNAVAETVTTPWLLLLNPDTETHVNAVENILAFGKAHPEAGITGGRTVFRDGSLNIASCWNTMSLWSLFCLATGLAKVFVNSGFFNPEGIGGWKRDSVRHVDVVVGCFMLVPTELWRELGGFSPRYFMYGEEHDFCLRAARLGYRPMITPDAEIMHLVGAATAKREDKIVSLMRSKATLIRDHWKGWKVQIGLKLLWLWIANRKLASSLNAIVLGETQNKACWDAVWRKRKDWLKGY